MAAFLLIELRKVGEKMSENGLEFNIDAEVKDASSNLDDLYDALNKVATLIKEQFKDNVKLKNTIRQIRTLSEINTTRLQNNLTALNNAMSDTNGIFKSKTFENFSSQVTSAENATNTLRKTMLSIAKINTDSLKNFDLTNIINQMNKFSSLDDKAISKFGTASKGIRDMSNAMARLSTMKVDNKNADITSGLNAQLEQVRSFASQFSEAFKNIKANAINAVVKAIKELPKAMESMEKLNVSTVGQTFDTLTQKLQSFLATLKEGSDDIRNFAIIMTKLGGKNTKGLDSSKVTKTVSSLKQVEKATKDVGNQADKTNKKLGNMLSFGKIYAFYNQLRHYGQGFVNLLQKSIDFAETENLFSRAMGNMRGEAMKFQQSLADMFGLAQPEMMKAQATFKNMLGNLGGLSDKQAYNLSERVTEMALDFSSLYNTTIDAAMTKFQAALSKQVRPIRSVSGYDITQNVLGATMQEIGINDRKISQMNEMEKRLLVILTLQRQMAASSAMGDFARTIEQPANQLRVLQQQLSEVGRWISAVFYGVISSVLPYINGFVMAIKEVIKSFALFLGYTMPDSSGSSDTILDQMDDGMSSINTGLEDAGKNIDKNKKKTKEWKNFLASFDVANVIPDQDTDNSDETSSDGAGGMSVDPRLLKALENYDYLFGNIKMKATEIAKKITEWIDKLNEGIKDNIFEPIKNSWKKYSPGILANVRETKNNIASILGGAIGVVEKKWKPFFQALSDLFFSLVDTVTNISSTITKLLKIIWDNGGKYLFDSLWDLATAFLELATSVNDNFVKPVINLIKKSVVPIFGTLLGKVLDVTGHIVKGFANVISWIAKCKPVVRSLGAFFTALFITIKVAKFYELIQGIRATGNTMSIFKLLLLEHSSLFRKLFLAMGEAKNPIKFLRYSYIDLNNTLVSTNVWQSVGAKIASFATKLKVTGTAAGGLVGVLKTKLGGALTWLATNPAALAIGAIAALVIGIAALGSKQKEKKYDMDDYSKSVQNQIKAVDGLKDSLKSAKESYNSAMQDAQANAEIAESALSKLDELGGATGIIDPSNAKEANNAMMLLNKSLGEEVVTIKNGKVEYQGSIDKIKERIAALKEQAEEEAKYQLYVEYTKAKIKADAKYNEVKSQYDKNQIRLEEIKAEKNKLGIERTKDYGKKIEALIAEENKLTADQDGLNKAMNKSKEATKNAEDGMKALDKTTKGMTDTTDKLSKKTAEFYASLKLSDKAGLGFEELGNQIKSTSKIQEKGVKDGKKLTTQEKNDIKNSRKEIIKKYAEQSKKYKVTYEDMLKILKKQGVKLSKEEEKQLKESMSKTKKHGTNKKKEIESQNKTLLELLKKSNIDVNSEKGKNYKKELENAQKQGTKEGKKYLDNLSKELKTPAKAKVNVEGAEKEGKKAQQTLFSLISNKTFFANVDTKNEGAAGKAANNTLTRLLVKTFTSTVRVSNADKAGSDAAGKIKNKTKDLPAILKSVIESAKVIQNKFNKKVKGVNMKATVTNIEVLESAKKALKSSISLALGMAGNWLGFKGYADGGYPDVGQMFIAREAGPELVGTMGGKTAVANNDQIVSGISSGVYQAVIQALRDGGSVQKQGGDIYITIENPDGTSTTKIIRDYIKYMNHNGGKGGIPV